MRLQSCMFLIVFALFFPAWGWAADQPNVVIIYGDDVGWGDLGCYGAEKIPTPNLDQLAADGLRFTDGHCSAATCTPSRFSLLTGVHAFRHGIRILAPNAPMAIKPDTFTLPDLFKQAGYDTAVVGKWHLGLGDRTAPVDWNAEVKPGPLELGFDHSFLLPSTNDRVPCVYLEGYRVRGLDPADPLFVARDGNRVPPGAENSTVYPNGKKYPEAMTFYRSTHGHNHSVINGIGRIGYQWGGKAALWDDQTMADVFVEETKKYLVSRKESDKPFFLYFASQDIHVPRAPHPRFQGKSELGYRGDAMVQLDAAVGEIMTALKENGLNENTLVIFSSDNGPVYDDGYDDGTNVKKSKEEVDRGHDGSGPYRGGKYQIYEGGTRVPLIVNWPGRVKPGVSAAAINQIDFVASFAELFGVELSDEQAKDSRSHLSALLGSDERVAPFMIEEAVGLLAIRMGDWKLIVPRSKAGKNDKRPLQKKQKKHSKPELYHLKEDVGERNNLAQEQSHQATLKKLRQQLQQVEKNGVRSLN